MDKQTKLESELDRVIEGMRRDIAIIRETIAHRATTAHTLDREWRERCDEQLDRMEAYTDRLELMRKGTKPLP